VTRATDNSASRAARSRADWRPWGIWLVALAVRAVYFLMYRQSEYWGVHLADQSYYRNWGMRIASGDWLGTDVFEQGPLYAYLLGIAYRLGIPDGIILALQLLAGSTVCLLVYACGRRLFDEPTPLVAGVMAAVYGPLIHAECQLMKSFLSPLFTMLACYGALRFTETRGKRWLLLSGGVIGLACLVTENHLLLMIPVAWWCCRPPSATLAGGASPAADRAPESARRGPGRLGVLLVLAASCAAPILPATVHNLAASHELVAVTSGGGEVFYMAWGPFATGNYEPPDFVRGNPYLEHEDFRREARRRLGTDLSRGESSRYWFREGFNSILVDPWRALRLAGLKGVILFNDFEVPDSEYYQVARELVPVLYALPSFGWLAGLGFVGLACSLRPVGPRLLPIGMLAMHVASVLLTYNFGRFRLGMTPLWILFAACGLVWLIRAARGELTVKPAVRAAAFVAAIAVTVASFLPSPGISAETLAAETQKNRDTLLQMWQTSTAAEVLEERLESRPNDAETHSALGALYLQTGKFYEAVSHLGDAVRLDPRSMTHHVRLAEAWARVGESHRALQIYEDALALDDGTAEAHLGLAAILTADGRLNGAVQHLRQAVQLAPRNAEAHLRLGNVCLMLCAGQGRPSRAATSDSSDYCREAAEHLNEAVRIEPRNLAARCRLADALQFNGRTGEALDQLEAAVRIESNATEIEAVLRGIVGRAGSTLSAGEWERIARLLEALADGSAGAGRFSEARRLARDAGDAAAQSRSPSLVDRMREKEAAFNAGRLAD